MKNGRVFLWRKMPNPYNIFIAEILLQRTDVKKIEKVYPKFLDICPSIHKLYEINDECLLDIFSEIGLYYRIRRLKNIAHIVISKYEGKIPNNKRELMSLPGVGEYISNAILCFAYKQKYPIVDTNVIRLYKRIFNLTSKKKRPHMDEQIWRFADDLLPEKNYVNFNYGILDFSNMVCKQIKPLCDTCIMINFCHFFNNQIQLTKQYKP